MTQQLRAAMAAVGPEAVQRTRLLLIAAGQAALLDRSIKCLLYSALATSTADRRGFDSDDTDWPDPLLLAAVVLTNAEDRDTVILVGDELDSVWSVDNDPLVYALAKELIMASCQAVLVLSKAEEELENFSDLGDWGGQ